MESTVAQFSIHTTSYIGPNGEITNDTPLFRDERVALVQWYKMMTLARVFDAKAINLQKQGRMGTYASCEGQEAVGVGVAAAMEARDVLVPTYRDQATRIMRAEKPEDAIIAVMLAWGGDERGHLPTDREKCDFPMCIPIATQLGHSVGAAMAACMHKERHAVVCMLGDGATSKGDTHEAMTFASVWNLPIVFVIQNNQYAISHPRHRQSGAETLAQVGIGAGIKYCAQVDGNDILAMYGVTREALKRARYGRGPTVIEAVTYRLGNHTTADDATRYRSENEVERARLEEPLVRMRTFLEKCRQWDERAETNHRGWCDEVVETAVARYEALLNGEPGRIDDMFEYLYETLPAGLIWQKEAARAFAKTREERHGS